MKKIFVIALTLAAVTATPAAAREKGPRTGPTAGEQWKAAYCALYPTSLRCR